MSDDQLLAIWRAVHHALHVEHPEWQHHIGCLRYRPEDCPLYEAIRDGAKEYDNDELSGRLLDENQRLRSQLHRLCEYKFHDRMIERDGLCYSCGMTREEYERELNPEGCRMIAPTFDADGYPTDETLDAIREWQAVIGDDVLDLIAYIREAWRYESGLVDNGDGTLTLYTFGWSGNESIISALSESPFWTLYWQASKRGGHYDFEVPALAKKERG